MAPWTAFLRKSGVQSGSGPDADYSPLPVSPGPLSSSSAAPSERRLPAPLHARLSAIRHAHRRLAMLALSGLALTALVGSTLVAVVPEEHLPASVYRAKQGVVDAAAAASSWHWDTASEVEGLAEDLSDNLVAESPVSIDGDPLEEVGVEPDLSEMMPDESEDEEAGVGDAVSEDEVECSASAQERVGQPSFWAVTETSAVQYTIAAREASGDDMPRSCLSHAVFSARLLSLSADGELDSIEAQTLVALDRPRRADDRTSYLVTVPSDLSVPRGRYQLEVTLNFGFYRGVLEGTPCGQDAQTCNERTLGVRQGPQLRYIGERIQILSGGIVDLGQDPMAELPQCTDLSSLDGYWSHLAYFPTSPACTLATPTFPLLFVPETPRDAPLWLHIVGDSNSRNMFTQFVDSLGRGRKIKASNVVDSPSHNGTLASVAFRYRSGVEPSRGAGGQAMPDLVITWQWWYESASSSLAGTADGDESDKSALVPAAVVANRGELVSIVDTDLASFLVISRLTVAFKHAPALKQVAKTLRPHRTYLSLGSHGERLALAGLSTSLNALFSETDGLSYAARERANLRLFTTTLVNARRIPLDRFPRQDLVRNNAYIAAKNAFAARHPALGGEGRVLDVEALTRGVVDSDEWMKVGRAGPDAVHFRSEVYDEWARLVWTDLLQGIKPTPGRADDAADEISAEEARYRWKRRLAWDEERGSEQDDEDDNDDSDVDVHEFRPEFPSRRACL